MKFHRLFLCIIILFLSYSVLSQKQNDNWFFGKYVGINFTPLAPNGYNLVTGSQMEALAGSAVMNDPTTGQLLFYTDGRTIWNKNHVVMSNGSGLRGSPSSAQPAVIVPKPGSNHIYYVFTMSGITDYQGIAERKGMAYSIVDMSLNSGLGGVTTKNVILFTNSDTEMLTSTLGHDGSYYWVVTQKESSFLAYKVSAAGVNTTPVTSAALYSAVGEIAKKGIKISPNSQHLAVAHFVGFSQMKVYVYSFNNSTGQVSNGDDVYSEYIDTNRTKNAMEFSPNSNVLYIGVYKQFLNQRAGTEIVRRIYSPSFGWPDIGDSAMPYVEGDGGDFPNSDNGVLSLQLAPNGKIMISGTTGKYRNKNFLAYIENSNDTSGSSMAFSIENNLSSTTHKIYKGFPQLVYLNNQPICEEDLFITQPVTISQDFQVSNKIEASSIVYQNLNVNFKASQIILKPGFSVSGYNTGVFRAVVDPCNSGIIIGKESESMPTDNIDDKTTLIQPVLFPNPATTVLNVNNIDNITEWKLVDINGKTVDAGKVNNSIQNKITINTGRLLPGIYYFNAVMKNGELFQKTVMKK